MIFLFDLIKLVVYTEYDIQLHHLIVLLRKEQRRESFNCLMMKWKFQVREDCELRYEIQHLYSQTNKFSVIILIMNESSSRYLKQKIIKQVPGEAILSWIFFSIFFKLNPRTRKKFSFDQDKVFMITINWKINTKK